MSNQFLLLGERKFLPLFVTQFLGAFHDNLFKNALIVMILYHIATQSGMSADHQAMLTTAAAGIFVLPFFIFSAIGGQLADKYPKNRVIQWIKLAEVGIAVLGAAALLSGSVVLSFVNLFALGAHSAFFGPCKYSILPEYLKREELIGGNALLNTGTFLAILLGTIAGAVIMGLTHGEWFMGAALILCALAGYAAARAIPAGHAAAAEIKINRNILAETFTVMGFAFSQRRDVVLAMLGKSWFFFTGSLFLSQFPNFVKNTLHAEETVFTLFAVLFSVGIGIGGLLNNRLLRGAVNGTFVPLAALGLSLLSLDLYNSAMSYRAPAVGLVSFDEFVRSSVHWRIMADVFFIAVLGGLFVVPLAAILQDRTEEKTRAQIMAGSSITDSLFMVASAVFAGVLIAKGCSIPQLFLIFAFANFLVAIYICRLLPDFLLKSILQGVFKLLYRVEVVGVENIHKAGKRAVIVGNHVSLLDPPLLAAFLPDRPMFAINTQVAKWWWVRPFLKLVDNFPIDPMNPYSIKTLIRKVEEDRHIVIFPEGRLTATGSLMKIYDGPGLIADRGDAMIVPVRIDGPQYTRFARLKNKMPFKHLPKIRITILEPVAFKIDENLKGRARRAAASRQLYDVMENMMLSTSRFDETLWNSLIMARDLQGPDYWIAEDQNLAPVTYDALVKRAKVLGKYCAGFLKRGENVGVLLPNSVGALVAFFALQSRGIVPALLNFTMGAQALSSACTTGEIKTILTSRKFIAMGRLDSLIEKLGENRQVIYFEDIAREIKFHHKLWAFLPAPQKSVSPYDPAVVLFTSGSEGAPKGVVLSHANLLSNIAQVGARLSYNRQDIVFNCLPMFHSFGLTGGTLLPVLSGVKTFLYPNPLHIRIIPELVYSTNATILFGTDTFLNGYARVANPYDFYGLRFIFAGAEKVRESTRKTYMDRYGVRILEGYGATETSPVIAVNSPMYQKEGSVGRPLAGIEIKLEPVEGITEGGRLLVRGPNVMLGYYKDDKPGVLQPPVDGWHDTGDIVAMDSEGYIKIMGRAKRFAKIAGEMVSLTTPENMASALWPEAQHAVIAAKDARKGEQLILATTASAATRDAMSQYATEKGIPALAVPAKIVVLDSIPVLGTGKTDYPGVEKLVNIPKTE
ncbi:MAG: acyl-[ACP]--phospholipid O-acyltransferase [Alphaproteobacteria bacterium]|nr:acyl-[ACP]--phospholipid O-acyltransferase [Alphaproteobacteria bacterium]